MVNLEAEPCGRRCRASGLWESQSAIVCNIHRSRATGVFLKNMFVILYVVRLEKLFLHMIKCQVSARSSAVDVHKEGISGAESLNL